MKTSHGRLGLAGVAVLGAALLLGGCDTDDLLEVPDPDVVSTPVFTDPTNLSSVLGGARREFARAYAGEQNDEGGQIHMSGTFADEMHHSGTFTTRQDLDARRMELNNGTLEEGFFELHRGRNHTELGASLFADSDEAGGAAHVELLALAGFSYIMFAENYCSGVPFSNIPLTGEATFGAPETTNQILQRALDRFSEAGSLSGASGDVADLIAVGEGRALLNQGDYTGAAQAVSGVDSGVEFLVAYNAAAQTTNNGVFNLVNEEKRWSVTGNEGTNGLPYFLGGDDPRLPATEAGNGANQDFIHFGQLKYPSLGADIPLATGVEARLIEAEAALAAEDRDEFFRIHNEELRSLHEELDALEDTGQTMAELVDIHFDERARWLWLTSHRLGDLRRLVTQYGRSADDVYPVGETIQSTLYGDQLSMPVPFSEQNNPSYDPSQCDPTQA